MHFPPRPCKSAWHCDITNVISPHGLPAHYKHSYHTIPTIIPLTSDTPRLHQHVSRSPVARRHANALPTKTSQMRMALRHHERNSPHGLPTHQKQYPTIEAKTLLSPAPQRCFPYYICTTNWPLLSPAPKSSFPYYICTTNWPLLSPAPKSSFP